MNNKKINALIARGIAKLSPKVYFSLAYLHNRCKLPNIQKPKDISEYWIAYILSGDLNKLAYLADKYEVRTYVRNKGLEKILPRLLGVWDSATYINFSQLPNRFALKMNFGAGMNIICKDKHKLDKEETIIKLTNWLNSPTYHFAETHYNHIPRKIICEEFIGNGEHFPNDYKFMCINGRPFCILACANRDTEKTTYLVYDLDWNIRLDYMKNSLKLTNIEPLPRPKHLSEMIEIAQKLSEGISLVRIDLYDTDEKVLFGEITLTPAGGIFHRWSQLALNIMGQIYRDTK